MSASQLYLNLRVVIGEIGAFLIAWVKTYAPDLGTQELDQQQRSIVEAEDTTVAACRIWAAIGKLLIVFAVGNGLWLLHACAHTVDLIGEELVGPAEDVVISKLDFLIVAFFCHLECIVAKE